MRKLIKPLFLVVSLGLPVTGAPIYMTGSGLLAFIEGPWGTDFDASGSSVDEDTVLMHVSVAAGFPFVPAGNTLFTSASVSNASIGLSSGETYSSKYFSYLFGDNGSLTLRTAQGDPIITVPISGYVRINSPT